MRFCNVGSERIDLLTLHDPLSAGFVLLVCMNYSALVGFCIYLHKPYIILVLLLMRYSYRLLNYVYR